MASGRRESPRPARTTREFLHHHPTATWSPWSDTTGRHTEVGRRARTCKTSDTGWWSLAPYAFYRNPVGQVWWNPKSTELTNLCPDTIEQASAAVNEGLWRISTETDLCFSFIHHAGLRR